MNELLEELRKRQLKYAINDNLAKELGTRAHRFIVDESEYASTYMELQNCKTHAQTFLFINALMKEHEKDSTPISPYVIFEQLMQFGCLARGRSLEENKAKYFAAFEGMGTKEDSALNQKEIIARANCAWNRIVGLVKQQEEVEAATLNRYLEELDLAVKSGQLKERADVPEAVSVQAG